MIHSTEGIVLNHVRYGETSAIVHIYTRLFGHQSYMVNGVRSTRNKGKSVLLQPLTLLKMQVYHKPGKDIQRIKEFSVDYPFATIPFDQTRRSIAFFITEMMKRSFREEEANEEMFQYIRSNIIELDSNESSPNFHLHFLAGLTRFLGFYPDLADYQPDSWFDLLNGHFSSDITPSSQSIESDMCQVWISIFDPQLTSYPAPQNADQRNRLTNFLIDYYSLHLPGFGNIKSLDILQTLYL